MAEQLKSEGNDLFEAQKYAEAHSKYSEAISAQSGNDKKPLAVLYANRAVCSFHLAKYLDSMTDGNQSTKLDPTYTKGWLRVAAAAHELGHLNTAKDAWTKGLACSLSDEKLSADMHSIFKVIFETGLARTESAIKTNPGAKDFVEISYNDDIGQHPSNRATMLIQQKQLKREPVPSSGFLHVHAAEQFKRGMVCLESFRTRPQPGALAFMADAILYDKRAVRPMMYGGVQVFFGTLQAQMQYESNYYKVFASAHIQQLKSEIQRRLKTSSMDTVYPSIAASVHTWIIAAFLEDNSGKHVSAAEQCKRALDVLQWGAQQFKDSRFDIFKPGFIRSVHRFHVCLAMGSYLQGNSGYGVDDISSLARELKAETENSIPEPANLKQMQPAIYAAQHVYPIAEAFGAMAWTHRMRGQLKERARATSEASTHFSSASRFYMRSANAYPEDEEEATFMLYLAAEHAWMAKSQLSVTLPICQQIEDSKSKSDVIWGGARSSSTEGVAEKCRKAIAFRRDCEAKIAAGKLSLDDVRTPAWL